VLWHRRLSRCVQFEFTSTTLATQLRNGDGDFTLTTGALVNMIESRLGDVNSVTRIGLVLKDASIPQMAGGCST
jgi:hypothetical protein